MKKLILLIMILLFISCNRNPNRQLAMQSAIYGYRVAKEGKLTEQQMIERLKLALDNAGVGNEK